MTPPAAPLTETLIWSLALAVVLAIVLGYLISFRRRNRRDHERARATEGRGPVQPMGAFPYIDPAVCIGCGGCVAACPEKVLGIVGGLAVAVQGNRCIGIAACAKACPVQAIEISLGDLRGRADVPWMTDRRETNVPGVYVAGELAGLALIRNAVRQGRETVRAIAAELAVVDSRDPELLDVAIIGAGPAGLAAALTAVESRLRYAVFEQQSDLGGTIYNFPRRKLTHTEEVELPIYGPLRKSEYSKEELLELFRGLLEKHRLEVRFGQKVLQVIPEGGLFHILTASNAWRARRVLLALGRRGTPRKLGVRGEALSKVMYQVRDAEEYRGKKILCVGGGDSAIEAAMGLARQAGNELTLSYRGQAFDRVKAKNLETLDKLVRRGKIRPLLGSEVLEIGDGEVRLRTAQGEIAIANDYVFVLIGGEPPFPFLRSIGVVFGNESAAAG
ncbi:MAG: NAD(P)-binding domain-containing protein [Thermoanaerobaculia bacterium]|nr:NAD(P)-binding domain-containing protein [Thermoanaerobaculia bacterium]MBP9823458.1 NAD(P)-binding domain-containing protein [Thermoanaerobaculia bacterium]